MKILQLIPNLSGGGAERFAVDLSNELIKNHEVILLTLYDEREEDLFRKQLNPQIQTMSLGKKIGLDLKIIPRLYTVIKKVAPDVIHNHLRTLNYLIPLIPFVKHTLIIHTVHNDAFKECPNPKTRKVREYLFRKKIMPVTISNDGTESFKKAYPNINYTLIYNGRKFPEKSEEFNIVQKELVRFKADEHTKVFLNIGRLIPQKNQEMLVGAFKKLVAETKANAILLIIGGGRHTDESWKIQQQLQQADREDNCIFLLGERCNATDYLYASDFFAMSSIYEGMPITLIEAFATGCIPVCTPVGGIPEMVNELEPSLLSKSTEIDDYYQVLKKAYEIPEDIKHSIKIQGRKLFKKKYSMELCARKYENLYRDLLTNTGKTIFQY